jgi:dGTPase
MISREIAEHLVRKASNDSELASLIEAAGGLDVTACEAAGLAHDLGHPPFGHAGEFELNRLLRARGVQEGFEGNAQSFRIVCRLDRHDYRAGLDLTNVTLAGILKYPWVRQADEDANDHAEQSKFGAYLSEHEFLKRARIAVLPSIPYKERHSPNEKPPQTLEASVMDLADDIAYSIHDLEDFCSQGFVDLAAAIDKLEQYPRKSKKDTQKEENPFAKSANKLAKFNESQFDKEEYERAVLRVVGLLNTINSPFSTQLKRDDQLSGELSLKIAEFFSGIVITQHESPAVSLETQLWHEMQVMKQVTKRYVIGTGRMGQLQRAQHKVVERLFMGVEDWLKSSDDSALPEPLVHFLTLAGADSTTTTLTSEHYRAIADYVCSMSDAEALLRSQWVDGREVPGMASLALVN